MLHEFGLQQDQLAEDKWSNHFVIPYDRNSAVVYVAEFTEKRDAIRLVAALTMSAVENLPDVCMPTEESQVLLQRQGPGGAFEVRRCGSDRSDEGETFVVVAAKPHVAIGRWSSREDAEGVVELMARAVSALKMR